jgi:4-hydroxy-4-methyl-2-oxoglutarate aldolase
VKVGGGEIGGTAQVGGVDVRTGDWVVGDRDGVTVVPGEQLDAVLAAGRARADKEAGMFLRLRSGATTVELLGLDTGPVGRPG